MGFGLQTFSSEKPRLSIAWEGSQFVHHSLALVNRELCLELLGLGHDVSIIPYEPHQFGPEVDPRFPRLADRMHKPLTDRVHAHIRHQWPPNFTPPEAGHWIMIQPWEYGRLPEAWIEPMSDLVDEMWVPSQHVRRAYVSSTIPAERVHVVPNGVNTRLFRPDVSPYPLETKKRFRFLFVGGTIWRKGVDLLLEAYRSTFHRRDDVVLIIKDIGQNSFYKGQGAAGSIRAIMNDPDAPEILHLTDTISEYRMPSLFRACHCLVHPYRGEGFGLPVLEAMACGTPVMVTEGGATDDFCTPESAYMIPSRRTRINMTDINLVGGGGWVLEPDLEALKRLLRQVQGNYREARTRAGRALERVRSEYTWEKVAEQAAGRVSSLVNKPIRRMRNTYRLVERAL